MTSKVGIVHSGRNNDTNLSNINALKKGLAWETNTIVEFHGPYFANDDYTSLVNIIMDLISNQNVDLLVAAGGTGCAKEAQKLTNSTQTPVVYTSVGIETRLADNMTGICSRTLGTDPGRLDVLHELLPDKRTFGGLVTAYRDDQKPIVNNEAAVLGLNPVKFTDISPAGDVNAQIEAAFDDWAGKVAAVLVMADPLFNDHRHAIIHIADGHNMPVIFQWREFAEEGGLISYGTNLTSAYILAGTYVGEIIDTSNPATAASLPILGLKNMELAINLKTAKRLNLDVPPSLILRADFLYV
jgi:putative tryptophan/tyrosine transport system substrate-binding protein